MNIDLDLFRMIDDVSGGWTWRINNKHEYDYVSDAAEPTLLFNTDFCLGWMRGTYSEQSNFGHMWETHMKDLRARRAFKNFVYPHIQAETGDVLWFRSSGSPIFDAEGRFDGYVGRCEDITLHGAFDQHKLNLFLAASTEWPLLKGSLAVAIFAVAEQNYSNADFSIDDWAQMAGVSRRTLQREMRNIGKTPTQHLAELRLDRAHQFLCSHCDKTVADVAFSVGYSDLSSFYRSYKKRFAEAPGVTQKRAAAIIGER